MEANRSQAGCLETTFILTGSAFLFIGVILFAADVKCAYDIENWWAPLYPNGETVEVEYDFFRPRALGRTTWVMESGDDVETVKQYYRDKRLETLNAEKTRGLAWAESYVTPLEDGAGSRIVLSSACGT